MFYCNVEGYTSIGTLTHMRCILKWESCELKFVWMNSHTGLLANIDICAIYYTLGWKLSWIEWYAVGSANVKLYDSDCELAYYQ